MPHFFGRSSASRGSMTPVGSMPPISEDENTPSATSTSPYPPPPDNINDELREKNMPQSPPKSFRKANGGGAAMPKKMPPPPYMPALHLPPRYKQRSEAGLAWNGAVLKKSGGADEERRKKEGVWCGWRWRTWLFVFIGVIVLLGLVIGLAVGLTVGQDDGNDNSDSSDDAGSNSTDTAVYPAGSYSFDTTLQDTSSGCTSEPATWRCYPYTAGGTATYSWIITNSSSSDYLISSTDNPFAPVFTNLTLTRHDASTPTEHFAFSFRMNRTVVPGDSITPNNRAATCTFLDTTFEATLWTNRHDNKTITPPEQGGFKFSGWPGDVQVVQAQDSEQGSPQCEDSDGNAIADVQAGSGTCECLYTSYDL